MSGVVSFRWPVSTTALQRVVGENGFFLLILSGERFLVLRPQIALGEFFELEDATDIQDRTSY